MNNEVSKKMKATEQIIKKSCIRKLWSKLNTDMRDEVCLCAEQMIEKNCETGPLKYYLYHSLIPTAAIYKVMIRNGMAKNDAFESVKSSVFGVMMPRRRKMKIIFSIPWLLHRAWHKMPDFIMEKFPPKGWNIQWIQTDKHEIRFNMRSCFYCDFFRIYECPELTPIFCSCDRLTYGMMKQFRFIRTQTLATGGNKCDFCFKLMS